MGARATRRILVIDDTSYIQSLLSLGLAGKAQVCWVRRVLEGVADALDAAMAGRPFDLIVLDRELVAGWKFEESVRHLDVYRATPILYFSWSLYATDESRALPIFSKRANILEILEAVRTVLRSQRPAPSGRRGLPNSSGFDAA